MDLEIRVVLKSEVSRDDTATLGWNRGWKLDAIGREGSSPLRDLWSKDDVSITYIEDPVVQLRYFVMRGPEARDVARDVREALAVWSVDETLGLLTRASGRDAKIHAIYLVALTASFDQDEQIVAAFRRVAQDGEVDARHALLVAIGYLASWPALRELAETIQREDPAPAVRRDAGFLLEGLDLADGG
ncbi:hypothetical protein J1792_22780 [Streptomyces triculaminicus]|uniref:HEAT repeat domain-containing protein n=2 Tax=Streptomyces TaxID=1883 RepID=A0A939JQE5_9ACTN|nr:MULTISPECIES: hypothetical protein [Streptomyces]MBO0655498.1 hypothetical protein [Streptomyces triculaminicus]QSY50669.1 hypothetical protein J3S04_06925 [Streptomyces griseocarneus]